MNHTGWVQNSKNCPDTMKQKLTAGWLATTVLLASCGGGGSPYTPTTPASCSLALQYANASNNSGIAIAQSDDWTRINTEVRRSLSCDLQRIQKWSVELCLMHPASDELHARLVSPDDSTVNLPLETAIRTTSCMGQDASHYLLSLTQENGTSANLTQSTGSWLIQVRDTVPGFGSGTLVGWSLRLEGLK